jgi:hypothetical protein
MFENNHYFIYTPTNERVFLMRIIYNTANSQIEIQSFPFPYALDNSGNTILNPMYVKPITASWSIPYNSTSIVPVYHIPATGMQTVVGFSSGYYPDLAANSSANRRNTAIGFLSNLSHQIYPSYTIMYYKPSNNRFATQGGVSSGDMTTRIKYETITQSALRTSTSLGSQVGNAMSYGVSENAYTLKDKLGYPSPKTPVVDKYTGELKCILNGRRTGYHVSSPNG